MKVTLVTLEEAARAAGTSPSSILRLEQQGYIHHTHHNGKTRYYDFGSIAQIIEARRKPYNYLMMMANMGTMPNTFRIVWEVNYDNGGAIIVDPFDIIKGCAGTLIDCTDYRKRVIGDINLSNPFKIVYLKHHDEQHTGIVQQKIDVVQLGKSDYCEVSLAMRQIWQEVNGNRSNAKLIQPKAFFGYELFEDAGCFRGRYLRYERYRGREWLADDIEEKDHS